MNQQANIPRRANEVNFSRFDAAQARRLRSTVEAVYTHSYVAALTSGDPFDSIEAFMHRFDSYASQSNFDLVVAYRDGEAIGQAWGWPLTEHTQWWTGLLAEPEPDFTHEDGNRTFALSEIMVSREWTGRGIAHALHNELLSARTESRATLLVEPENTTAYRAYLHWGWRKVAQLRPRWDHAPTFDVLILTLDKKNR
ncbi:MAG: GNAT family N-acetyltransferase [Pseudonocardiales bacterium]|nr:GNAT family N-acetyltransferase [Pseudonocardiales bacterium]